MEIFTSKIEKLFSMILVLGLLCFNTTYAADNIKPKKINEKTFRDLGSGF